MPGAAIVMLLMLTGSAHAQVEQAPPATAEQLRPQLIGKPVHAAGGGRIGEIAGIAIGPDGGIGAVTVAIDGSDQPRRHLPVAWPLIRAQIDNPTIILPWDAATLGWLTNQR